MAANDICAEIAAVLNPMPAPADQEQDDDWGAPAARVWEEREEEAGQLRLSWEEGGIDPLLSTLASLRAQRLRLEADMRLMIAYARRFTHPRPYKLIDLAEACRQLKLPATCLELAAKHKLVPHYLIDGQLLFEPAELNRWVHIHHIDEFTAIREMG